MKKTITALVPLFYGKYLNTLVLFNSKKTAKIAYNIFSKVRKGKVLPFQKEFLDAAKLSVEEVENHTIQTYHWKGSKPRVLLMHGWESNTYRWRNLIKKLQEANFDIIAFDAPAHGYSSGQHLHVPLYSLASRHVMDKYRPQYVVAHSMGGITILYDHFKKPESSVEKIVTIGAPSEFSQSIDYYQNLVGFNNTVRAAMDKRLKEWFNFYFHEFSSARFVATNTKKGLLFHDEEDAQVPFSASKKVHQHWQGSKLITTKGLGHSMHQDAVNEQIITFLAS